jgi:putative spermidine/putrescine transport system ATP-binding protein
VTIISLDAGNEMDKSKLQDVFIQNVSKHFGEIKAVDQVTFSIKGGEFLTLLGPSGSGKTTLLNMIAGFFRPTNGVILIGERDITVLPPEKRDVGMTFQNYALFPHMTVAENIAFPLRMKKVPKQEIADRIKNALELVRLSGFESRHPKQLSGGQQQRISLARSIVFDPSLLLMDEPLGALDKKLRQHMQLELKQLQRKLQMTVVYVTHDQEEALTMSDRIAVMNEGRIEQIDTPDEIYQHPKNWFVADFIGESNFIDGNIIEINADNSLIEIPTNKKINGPKNEWMRAGMEVFVLLRPERLNIHLEKPIDARNLVSGTIQDDFYVGNISRYLINIPESDFVLNVELRNAQETFRFKSGQDVFVSWHVNDTIIIPK